MALSCSSNGMLWAPFALDQLTTPVLLCRRSSTRGDRLIMVARLPGQRITQTVSIDLKVWAADIPYRAICLMVAALRLSDLALTRASLG